MSFSLNRKTDYALVALSSLIHEHTDQGQPQSAREIAERHDLPLPLLMNALKDLHRSDIIASRRGAGGGYFLEREPDLITLLEVIEALEGPVSVTLCSDEEEDSNCGSCQIFTFCPISGPMQKLNGMLNVFLNGITLKDFFTSGIPDTIEYETGVKV